MKLIGKAQVAAYASTPALAALKLTGALQLPWWLVFLPWAAVAVIVVFVTTSLWLATRFR